MRKNLQKLLATLLTLAMLLSMASVNALAWESEAVAEVPQGDEVRVAAPQAEAPAQRPGSSGATQRVETVEASDEADDAAQLMAEVTAEEGVASITKDGATTYYDTFQAAVTAAEAGDEIIILQDVTATQDVTIQKTLTIDLNGKTYTAKGQYDAINFGGAAGAAELPTLTLRDSQGGGALVDGLSNSGSDAIYFARGGGKLVIEEGATVKGLILISAAAKKGTSVDIEVSGTVDVRGMNYDYNGVTIRQAAIQGNGSVTANTKPTSILITPTGKLYADNTTIYQPQSGTVTVAGMVEGGSSGIAMKSGTLRVTSTGTVSCVGPYTAPTEGNGNGVESSGAAIQIEANSAYAGDIQVYVEPGATVKSANGNAVYQYSSWKADQTATDANAKLTAVEIEGGTFLSGEGVQAIETREDQAEKVVVSGGSFSSDVREYLAEGLKQSIDGQVVDADADVPGLGDVAKVSETYGGQTDVYYTSLQDALNDVADNATVTMLADETSGSVIWVYYPVKLDMAGKTISNALCLYPGEGFESSGIDVTVENGTVNGMVQVQNGAVTLKDVTVANTVGYQYGLSLGGTNAGTGYWGSAQVIGGSISGNFAGVAINGTADKTSELTLSGGAAVTGTWYGIAGNGGTDNTNIVINDAKVLQTENSDGQAIYHPQEGTLTINEGAEIEGLFGVQICAGEVIVNGGTITARDTAARTAPYKADGEKDGSVMDGAALSVVSRANYGDVKATILGGDFRTGNPANAAVVKYGFGKNSENKWSSLETCPTAAEVAISGGTFSTDVSEYCVADFKAQLNEATGKYGIVAKDYVAQVGENKYETLQAAIAAAEDGQMVELLKDVTATGELTVKSGVTLDGKGHTLTNNSGRVLSATGATVKDLTIEANGDGYAIYTNGNTIVENCVFNGTTNWQPIYVRDEGAPDVVVTGCTFNTKHSMVVRSNTQFTNNTLNGAKGLTISGDVDGAVVTGNIFNNARLDVYPIDNDKVTIEKNQLLGESFVELEPGKTYTQPVDLSGNYWPGYETSDKTSWAEGQARDVVVVTKYDTADMTTLTVGPDAVAQVGSVYYTTLQAAIDAAQTGETVTVLKDVATSEVILVDKSLTIEGGEHKITSAATRILRVNASDVTVTLNDIEFVSAVAERGVQVDPNMTGVVLNINRCTIPATYYAINICNNVGVTLNIDGCDISGWGALNLWSARYDVTVKNSKLTGHNDKDYNADGWNGFGTIVLEGDTTGQTEDHAEDCHVVLENCQIIASTAVNADGTANIQKAILFNAKSSGNVVEIKGDTTIVSYTQGELTPFCVDNGEGNTLAISGGTFDTDVTDYCVEGYLPLKNKDGKFVVTAHGESDHDFTQFQSWGDWTAAEGGYTRQAVVKCAVCDATESQDATVTVETVAATCKDAGSSTYTSAWGEGESAQTDTKVDVIEKLTTHTPGQAVRENVVDATCSAEGSCEEVVYCSVCQAELSRETKAIDKLAHTEAVDAAVAATCTETGKTEGKHCSVCNEILIAQETVSATGHTLEWAHDDDSHWQKCANCDHAETAQAHTWRSVGVSGGVRTETCDACGAERTQRVSTGGTGGYVPPTVVTRPTEELDDPDTPLAEKPFLFTDVAKTDWYYDAVKYVFENDLMKGASETVFNPHVDTDRGMIVTMLYRLEKEPKADAAKLFADVAQDRWYTDAVAWGVPAGVVKGYDNGNFGPEDKVTREQLALFLLRYAQLKGYDVTGRDALDGFTDSQNVSAWALDAVQWAVSAGLLKGDNGELQPGDNATRAEAAAMFARFAKLFAPGEE